MQNKKTSNGFSMQGICNQHYVDNCELTDKEFRILSIMLRRSFGYRHRWCYLKYDEFGTNRNTISKTLKSLNAKGMITYKPTYLDGHRGLSEYRILEPKLKIKDFIFIKHKDEEIIKKDYVEQDIKDIKF